MSVMNSRRFMSDMGARHRGMRHFNQRFVQAPEASDVMRRGNSHIQEKCTGSTATLSARRRRERHAMRHAADGKFFDQHLTARVIPYAARVASDRSLKMGSAHAGTPVTDRP